MAKFNEQVPTDDPQLAFVQQLLKQQLGKRRIRVTGSYQREEDDPESARGLFSDPDGTFSANLVNIHRLESVDGQSVGPLDIKLEERLSAEAACAGDVPVDCWETLGNSAQAVEERVAALNACMLESPMRTAALVASELSRVSVGGLWRNHLVVAAESLQFESMQMRATLADRLIAIARELRKSRQSFDARTVWSALRTYASVISRDRIESLLEFLNGEGSVDTRLVALQCVVRVFEVAPPKVGEIAPGLSDCVHSYAEKMVDPLVITPGEVAAIALNAIHALAAICDARLPAIVQRAVRLRKAWFARQAAQRLAQLAIGWQNSGADGRAAAVVLQEQAEALASESD